MTMQVISYVAFQETKGRHSTPGSCPTSERPVDTMSAKGKMAQSCGAAGPVRKSPGTVCGDN